MGYADDLRKENGKLRDSLRRRIGAKVGLPPELLGKVGGDTAQAMDISAKLLLKQHQEQEAQRKAAEEMNAQLAENTRGNADGSIRAYAKEIIAKQYKGG